jgi:hypothetical protein
MSRMFYKVLLAEKITATDVARVDPQFAKHRIAAVLAEGGVAEVEVGCCVPTSVPRTFRFH